jgi:hypothetical protein
MFKVTSTGVKQVGEERELSREDQQTIWEMFEEYSNYEKPPENLRDFVEDELYED